MPLLLYVVSSVLSLLLLGYLGYLAWRSWKRLNELELKDRFAARNDFIKTTAQILGGAFFLITIYFTYQNLAVSQKNLTATQERNITDLFTKAIEQLGNEKSLEVRLGGIYALERIARESPIDQWNIMDVLSAYVRWNAPWPPEKLEVAQKKRPWAKPRDKDSPQEPPDADIQAVLTVLGRTAIPFAPKGEERRLDLQSSNLSGAYLYKPNLQWAFFYKTNLQGASLWGANLQGAFLREANLQGAKLWFANLQGAVFEYANLQGAHLIATNLQGADLEEANLRGADLRGPEGRNLGAKGLTAEQVAGAFWDETTKWPEGFSPPAPRRLPPKE